MVRLGDSPEFLFTASCTKNHFTMAAGQCAVFPVANDEDGKSATGDGFFGRDFQGGKAGQSCATIDHKPRTWREERFAEPGILAQAGIVVSSFLQIGERGFGDYGFDARIDAGGLE